MYYDHFGLSEPPFRITPNIGFFFGGGKRGPILEALVHAVTQGEGMVKVTGEVGSGKTMLCNMLQARRPLKAAPRPPRMPRPPVRRPAPCRRLRWKASSSNALLQRDSGLPL